MLGWINSGLKTPILKVVNRRLTKNGVKVDIISCPKISLSGWSLLINFSTITIITELFLIQKKYAVALFKDSQTKHSISLAQSEIS